jgi:hypothetical protein
MDFDDFTVSSLTTEPENLIELLLDTLKISSF